MACVPAAVAITVACAGSLRAAHGYRKMRGGGGGGGGGGEGEEFAGV
jgi:hypothetical protein